MSARGVALRLTKTEAEALNTFGEGVLAANSVDQWASCEEGTPYYYADRALMAALTEIFGEFMAKNIREDMLSGGENATYVITHFYNAIITDD